MRIKFLIVRFSSIGDIVLTSPVIRAIKQQVEDSQIHYVCKLQFAEILQENPNVDKIHVLESKMKPLLDELENEDFDYIIDLHNNIRSGQIKRRLKKPSFTFNKLNFRKWVLVNFKYNTMPQNHVVDRYMETLAQLKIEPDNKGLEYYIPISDEYNTELLPAPFSQGFIAFSIGGAHLTKCLPPEKVIEICHQISFPVVLIGGKNEHLTGEQIVSALPQKQIVNLCGKLSINQSASVIKKANLVLTNDTGMMHIAAAYKKKILSFWGNTVSEFGMVPYHPHPESAMLQVDGLKCRPCTKLGFRKCPRQHFRCMMDMNISLAIKWIKAHFANV